MSVDVHALQATFVSSPAAKMTSYVARLTVRKSTRYRSHVWAITGRI
jgi:hypothetical protein